MTLIEMAIAFVIRHPAVTSAIIGPRTMEHLESQLTAADVVLVRRRARPDRRDRPARRQHQPGRRRLAEPGPGARGPPPLSAGSPLRTPQPVPAVAASAGKNASTDSSETVTSTAVPNVVTVEKNAAAAPRRRPPAAARPSTASPLGSCGAGSPGIAERLVEQLGQPRIAGQLRLALQPVDEMALPLGQVEDPRRQPVRVQRHADAVDRRHQQLVGDALQQRAERGVGGDHRSSSGRPRTPGTARGRRARGRPRRGRWPARDRRARGRRSAARSRPPAAAGCARAAAPPAARRASAPSRRWAASGRSRRSSDASSRRRPRAPVPAGSAAGGARHRAASCRPGSRACAASATSISVPSPAAAGSAPRRPATRPPASPTPRSNATANPWSSAP